ncbi:MAG: p-hydroxycinnamoyl CoA hydratase/lyase [Chloroflexota bacterium]|nr:p-hydroxycinnamoyl CoA hydratase/lyase [Chloroflexota bacterium]
MNVYQTVKVDREDKVTWVTLNRPEKKNAMNPQLNSDMVACLTELEGDPETHVLVLTGAGEAWSAGMDLREYFRALDDDASGAMKARWATRTWTYHKLRFYPKPTIAAVNGWCFGGAFTPLISCDFAIAAEEATFGLSEVNWGMIPAGLVSRDLALAMSYRDALYYSLTGKTFTAQRAREMGLVNEVVPRAQLHDAVMELAGCLTKLNPSVLQSAKEALKQCWYMDYDQANDFLGAKIDQMRFRDPERGRQHGLTQFLDEKIIRPGLEPYVREP